MANNLYQRIAAVIKAVSYVKKDVNVSAGAAGSYRGVSHDAVVGKLRTHMAEHGLMATISVESSTTTEGATRSGARRVIYQARYRCRLVNVDDPNDALETIIEAHADDGGDKAPGKALSYALKMFLLKAFLLETGDEEEGRFQPDGGNFITDEQQARLLELVEATESDKDKVLQWLGVTSFAELPAPHYKRAESALLKKLKAPEVAHG